MQPYARVLIDVIERQHKEIAVLRELLTPDPAKLRRLRSEAVSRHYALRQARALFGRNGVSPFWKHPDLWLTVQPLDRPDY